MKRLFPLFLVVTMFASLSPQAAYAKPLVDEPLCFPGPYQVAEVCMPLVSWAYFSQLAALGISLPLEPLPATTPDINLSVVPYYYGRVTAQPGPVFAPLQDAQARAGKSVLRYIETGFDYISYVDVQVIDGKKFYMIQPGEWMRGGDVSGGVARWQFIGLQST